MSQETRYSKLKLKEIAIELKLKRKAPTLVIMTYDQQNTHPAVLTSKRLKGRVNQTDRSGQTAALR